MLPGREESNSVGFGADSMNAIQAAAGRIALDTLNVLVVKEWLLVT